jgi:hypothetical protein
VLAPVCNEQIDDFLILTTPTMRRSSVGGKFGLE